MEYVSLSSGKSMPTFFWQPRPLQIQ